MSETTPAPDVRRALAWAAFLGASWTWVIGMFLPVLLIRDFGPAGWLVFAIPNVVGAAAMGWVIRSREQGEAFVANHRPACQAFSLVTIAFHAYVLLWLVPRIAGPAVATIGFGAALFAAFPILTSTLRPTTLAIATLVVSVLIAAVLFGLRALAWPATTGVQSGVDLLALGAVCLLGFLTCPYLDLTFHRARQACRTPGESRVAFGVGFGVCFAAMIVLTFFYAALFLGARVGTTRLPLTIVAAHLCVQAALTVGLHAASFRAVTATPRGATGALIAAFAVPTALAFAVHAIGRDGVDPAMPAIGPQTPGEIVYRTFMAFYGLVAPAYVWLCVRRADAPPEPAALRAAAIAALVAAPFFWVGFMHGAMRWSLPGVLALLAGWVVVTVGRRKADLRERGFKALGGHLQQ